MCFPAAVFVLCRISSNYILPHGSRTRAVGIYALDFPCAPFQIDQPAADEASCLAECNSL
jgi:hypothetical protein